MTDSSISTPPSPGSEYMQDQVTNYEPSEPSEPDLSALQDDHYSFSSLEKESQAEDDFEAEHLSHVIIDAITALSEAIIRAISAVPKTMLGAIKGQINRARREIKVKLAVQEERADRINDEEIDEFENKN